MLLWPGREEVAEDDEEKQEEDTFKKQRKTVWKMLQTETHHSSHFQPLLSPPNAENGMPQHDPFNSLQVSLSSSKSLFLLFPAVHKVALEETETASCMKRELFAKVTHIVC